MLTYKQLTDFQVYANETTLLTTKPNGSLIAICQQQTGSHVPFRIPFIGRSETLGTNGSYYNTYRDKILVITDTYSTFNKLIEHFIRGYFEDKTVYS